MVISISYGIGETLESGFFFVEFAQLLADEVKTENSKANDLRSGNDLFNEFRKDVIGDFGRNLIYLNGSRCAEDVFLFFFRL